MISPALSHCLSPFQSVLVTNKRAGRFIPPGPRRARRLPVGGLSQASPVGPHVAPAAAPPLPARIAPELPVVDPTAAPAYLLHVSLPVSGHWPAPWNALGSSTPRSRWWSSPIPAANSNRLTRWPGPGLAPAFHRRTMRALTFRRRASSRQDSPAACRKRSRRSGKSWGNSSASTW